MSRIHYSACEVWVGALEEGAADFSCDDAEVWVENSLILISYFDDEGIVVLEGTEDRDQGWELMARSRPRRAFLRPLAEKAGCFVGEIDEQGETAPWRVSLGAPQKEDDV